MNAMTWYDHTTGSVWSQVWGQSIAGPLKGTTLDLIPASIVPWGTWQTEHPNTLAMINDKGGFFGGRQQLARDGWVVGITLGEYSKAYHYPALAEVGVINDFIGPYPITLYTDPDSRNVHAYLRQVDDTVLTLALADNGQHLVDAETGSRWDISRGLAQEGALQGQTMLLVPYISSFDWAWLDFYPNSEFFPE